MINKEQVQEVLIALGEEFIVDIQAVHDGKGGYTIDYFELVTTLVNAPDSWADRIAGYVNSKALSENRSGVTFAPALAHLF